MSSNLIDRIKCSNIFHFLVKLHVLVILTTPVTHLHLMSDAFLSIQTISSNKILESKIHYFELICQNLESTININSWIKELWGIMKDMFCKHNKYISMHLSPPHPPWSPLIPAKFIFSFFGKSHFIILFSGEHHDPNTTTSHKNPVKMTNNGCPKTHSLSGNAVFSI